MIVSSPLLDKLEVYRGLGIREVWLFRNQAFQVLALRGDAYVAAERSEVFPEVDLTAIARHAVMPDQHAALRAFRDELRAPR